MVQNNDMPLVFTMNLASDIEAMSRIAEKAMEMRKLRIEDVVMQPVKVEMKEQLLSIGSKKFG